MRGPARKASHCPSGEKIGISRPRCRGWASRRSAPRRLSQSRPFWTRLHDHQAGAVGRERQRRQSVVGLSPSPERDVPPASCRWRAGRPRQPHAAAADREQRQHPRQPAPRPRVRRDLRSAGPAALRSSPPWRAPAGSAPRRTAPRSRTGRPAASPARSATAASTCGGTVFRCSVSERGSSVITRAMIACAVGPVNGGSPASIS